MEAPEVPARPTAQVRLDHLIVFAKDKRTSVEFFAEMFGEVAPVVAGPFAAVRLSDGRILDFAEPCIDFPGLHLAMRVDDATFDAVVGRLRAWRVEHWADPQQQRPGEINTDHGGRGVYFLDPGGNYLEALTARYDGSALT
jgi:catechol 2,3-dioxygenase-like lactoylglutathione lyase family enzyme